MKSAAAASIHYKADRCLERELKFDRSNKAGGTSADQQQPENIKHKYSDTTVYSPGLQGFEQQPYSNEEV